MITVNGSDVATVIAKIIRIAPKAVEAIFVNAVSPTQIAVRGFHEQRYVTFFVKAKCEKGISFICAGDRLKSICDKRGEMVFTKPGKIIKYKEPGKSYAGSLEISELEVEFPKIERNSEFELNDRLKHIFITLSELALLKSIYENRELFYFAKIDEKRAVIASGDRYHMAYCSALNTKSKNNLDFAIPISYWNIIKQTFNITKEKVSIKTTNNMMHIFNEDALISLPIIATNSEDAAFDDIERAFKMKDRPKLFEGIVDIDAVNQAIANMEAIRETEKALELNIKVANGLLQMRAETRHGSMKESVPIKNAPAKAKAAITLETNMLKDVLSKLDESVVFRIFEGDICQLEKEHSKEKSLARYILLGLKT